jgi:ATP-dependent metalloprotease
MITKWGFSQKLGVQYLDDKEKFSGETQSIIDSEVRRLLDESYSRAKTLLQTHKKELALVAEALMEHETLSGSEVADVVKGKALNLRIRSQKASRDPKPIPEQKKKKPILPSPAAAGVPVVKPGVPKPTVPATASTKAPVAAVVPATVASPATAAATENVAVQSQTEKKAPSNAPIRGPPVTPKSS